MVVSHDGALDLPRTLGALTDQSRPVDSVIGVDAGSADASRHILEQWLEDGRVVSASTHGGFGGAVAAGLSDATEPAPSDPAPTDSAGPRQQWLWLLHHDSVPDTQALAELLRAVELAPSATIAGAKQLDRDRSRRLVDVGLSTSTRADRLTQIEYDELDQGQYDGRTDTFAVNSAGMLIRRDVWDSLGGFDPALPGAGDDIDLCWRNRLAGHRVIVVPAARIYHGEPRSTATSGAGTARRAEVYLRLKHAPAPKMPFIAVAAVLGGLLRFAISLLAKDPGFGARQLAASLRAVASPVRIAAGRRAAARSRRVSRRLVSGLLTPRREVREHRRSWLESFIAEDDHAGHDAFLASEPSGDSADDFAALSMRTRGWAGTGAVVAAVLLTAVSLLGLQRLIGAGALTGGALLPVSESLADIWDHASGWWIGLGLGFAGHGDPFGYVLWLVGAAGFGHPSAAVVILVLVAMPLAGLGAWFAAGALSQSRWLRFWAAMAVGAAPALQAALGQGRLGALIAHMLLPWVVLGMVRAVGAARGRRANPLAADGHHAGFVAARPAKPGTGGRPSWTAAAAAGLLLAAVTASAPSLLIPSILVVIGLSIALRSRARTLWWSLLPSLALFVPYFLSTADRPRAALADPGLALPFDRAPLWQQLLGFPVTLDADTPAALSQAGLAGAGWAPAAALLIGAPLVLLAAAALFAPGPRAWVARIAWMIGLLFLAASAASAQVAVARGDGRLVTAFDGPEVSVAILMLLAAALTGADIWRVRGRLWGVGVRPSVATRLLVGSGASLLVLGPALSLALWVVPQASDDGSGPGAPLSGGARMLEPGATRTLPATATDLGEGTERSRTLVLRTNDDAEIAAALMHGGGTTADQLSTIAAAHTITGEPGKETVTEADPAASAIRHAAASIVGGTAVDPRETLQRLGAGFVVLRSSGTASELLAQQINGVPGLAAVGETDSGWLWRVIPLDAREQGDDATGGGARVRIVDEAGHTERVIASGESSVDTGIVDGEGARTLVLAERADPHWTATLDGRTLEPTTHGFSQAFELPADGGHLTITYAHPWAPLWAVVQIVVLGATVLLAIPVPARRPSQSHRGPQSIDTEPEKEVPVHA